MSPIPLTLPVPQPNSRFFAHLPPEIRQQIYILLLSAASSPWHTRPRLYPSILQACRLAYIEALPVLYGHVPFRLNALRLTWTPAIPEHLLPLIREVRIWCGEIRGCGCCAVDLERRERDGRDQRGRIEQEGKGGGAVEAASMALHALRGCRIRSLLLDLQPLPCVQYGRVPGEGLVLEEGDEAAEAVRELVSLERVVVLVAEGTSVESEWVKEVERGLLGKGEVEVVRVLRMGRRIGVEIKKGRREAERVEWRSWLNG